MGFTMQWALLVENRNGEEKIYQDEESLPGPDRQTAT